MKFHCEISSVEISVRDFNTGILRISRAPKRARHTTLLGLPLDGRLAASATGASGWRRNGDEWNDWLDGRAGADASAPNYRAALHPMEKEGCVWHGMLRRSGRTIQVEIQTKFRNVTLKLLRGGGVTLP